MVLSILSMRPTRGPAARSADRRDQRRGLPQGRRTRRARPHTEPVAKMDKTMAQCPVGTDCHGFVHSVHAPSSVGPAAPSVAPPRCRPTTPGLRRAELRGAHHRRRAALHPSDANPVGARRRSGIDPRSSAWAGRICGYPQLPTIAGYLLRPPPVHQTPTKCQSVTTQLENPVGNSRSDADQKCNFRGALSRERPNVQCAAHYMTCQRGRRRGRDGRRRSGPPPPRRGGNAERRRSTPLVSH